MSFFKRVLSSVGIGSAKVDTVLDNDRYAPGDLLTGTVHITAGDLEQRVDEIYFSIHSTYEVERDDTTHTYTATLAKYKLADPFTLHPGDRREIAVSFPLPHTAPLTLGKTKVWVQTGLDIKQAIDPGDRDYLQVMPGQWVAALFQALEQLGFSYYEAECEQAPAGFRYQVPFVQEFEFKPYRGQFAGRLDELEVVCFPSADRVEILLEIDRRARGGASFLDELLNRDETRLRLILTEADVPNMATQLREIIGHYSY